MMINDAFIIISQLKILKNSLLFCLRPKKPKIDQKINLIIIVTRSFGGSSTTDDAWSNLLSHLRSGVGV